MLGADTGFWRRRGERPAELGSAQSLPCGTRSCCTGVWRGWQSTTASQGDCPSFGKGRATPHGGAGSRRPAPAAAGRTRSGAAGFAPPRRAPFPSLFLTQQQLSAPTRSQIREQETSGSSPLILIPPAQGLWGRQGSPHPLGYRPHRSGTPSRAPRPPGASSASWLSSASCSRTSAPAR